MFNVRPVCADDEAALAKFFKHVTPDDIRFRFLTGMKYVGRERLFTMADVDHRQTENFIAFVDDDSEIIATAMLACDADLERGEVAIAIRSDFKNDGVGWEMLKLVTRHANSIGVKIIESIESPENHAAIDIEREMGFIRRCHFRGFAAKALAVMARPLASTNGVPLNVAPREADPAKFLP
jgi:RimJ/RimL family protein N-acetyltransferase